ncbi:MAG: TolC family protein [Acidobacteria bacterium]|nr:TolC family protein [Acidobacteriota bacterium]
MKVRGIRALGILGLAGVAIASPYNSAVAQDKPFQLEPKVSSRDYSKGQRAFPTFFAPYTQLKIDEPVLTNSPRLDQMLSNGKINISLKDTIALALENNLDITVQRYTPWLAQTDVLKNQAVSSNGRINFDPIFTSTIGWQRTSQPINNPFLAGTGTASQTALTSQTSTGNFNYNQGFHTGTSFNVAFSNSRSSTTSASTFLNPSVQSSIFATITQPLLNGFGPLANTRFLRIAKNNLKIADLTFSNQVILTISRVEQLYWDLVFAREDVKVKQRSVELAQKLLSDNKRQVEIGTLAPIEVVRAEAEVARTSQDLIVAQTFLLQQQELMKNAITKNPMSGPLVNVEIIPTDPISTPALVENKSLEDAVKEAWNNRPDIKQARIDLDSRDITVKATHNALLPALNLQGQYGTTGLSGNQTVLGTPTTVAGTQIVDATGTPVANLFVPRTVIPVTGITQAGWGDALDTVFRSNFPTYSVTLSLTLPIRNRSAQADNARAQLEQRQAESRVLQLQNSIVVEVRNAQIGVQQSVARVEAAKKSRELAERTLDAEQKKNQLGASTIFFVIQAQRDLAAAQSVEVQSLSGLLKAQVEYERALGRTLASNKIDVADAKKPQPMREPNIPGTPADDAGTRQQH